MMEADSAAEATSWGPKGGSAVAGGPTATATATATGLAPSPSAAGGAGMRCSSALSERTNTTSSTDSFSGADVSEFLADIQMELLEQYGAVGKVSQHQLVRTLTAMGLEGGDMLMHGLWSDVGQSADQPLAMHDILTYIAQNLTPRVRTPADGSGAVAPGSAGGSAPESASHTPKFSKTQKGAPSVHASPVASWWGISCSADAL